MRDAQKRRPGEKGYDPTTLFIPPNGLKDETPARQQYWKIKSENFDKVILFKLGKFYEFFEEDAVLAVKYLGINFMGNKKRAGFPEQSLDKYIKILVQNNFKVAIVEQVETAKELQERIKQKDFKQDTKILKRDIVKFSTRATHTDFNCLEEEAEFKNHIWVINESPDSLYITIFNFQTNEILLQTYLFTDPQYLNNLKTLLTKFPISEVLLNTSSLCPTLKLIIENLPNSPTIIDLHNKQVSVEFYENKIKNLNKEFMAQLAHILALLPKEDRFMMWLNITSLFQYLDSLLVLE